MMKIMHKNKLCKNCKFYYRDAINSMTCIHPKNLKKCYTEYEVKGYIEEAIQEPDIKNKNGECKLKEVY